MALPQNYHSKNDPTTYSLDLIAGVILGGSRTMFDPKARVPDGEDLMIELMAAHNFWDIMVDFQEKLVSTQVRADLMRAVYKEKARRDEKGLPFDSTYALHYIDTVITEALMGTIGTFFGQPSGTLERSSQVMKAPIGNLVNNALRQIRHDLCLYNLPPYVETQA